MITSRLESYYNYLVQDPLGFLIYFAYMAVTILLSLILHEIAHGYTAWCCGDPTAKMMGRLSLNPAKHLDPWGTASMLIFGVGWAKPVPVNPRNYRNGRRDDILVSVAGIIMNLTLFILCGVLSVVINGLIWKEGFLEQFRSQYGSLQGLLNIYTEGDASSWASVIAYGTREGVEFLTRYAQNPWLLYVQRFLLMMTQINLNLAVFNLIPMPPLDGWHLLNDTILKGRMRLNPNTFRIMQIALIVACLSGALSSVLTVVNRTLYTGVINLFLVVGGLA